MAPVSAAPTDALKGKTMVTYERLVALFGAEPLVPRREPMHELISTMLSHRTTQQNEATAYAKMRERYPTWEEVRDAPLDELIETIEPATFPEVKAPRIQETLDIIIRQRGEASIDFLAELPTEDALAWLTNLPGVGVKTATLVLLFCFAKPVLPVDTHVHRVSGRVGLIPPKMGATAAHAALLKLLPEDAYVLFNFHKALLKHGQRICIWRDPKCEQCPLTDICDWYQANRAGKKRSAKR